MESFNPVSGINNVEFLDETFSQSIVDKRLFLHALKFEGLFLGSLGNFAIPERHNHKAYSELHACTFTIYDNKQYYQHLLQIDDRSFYKISYDVDFYVQLFNKVKRVFLDANFPLMLQLAKNKFYVITSFLQDDTFTELQSCPGLVLHQDQQYCPVQNTYYQLLDLNCCYDCHLKDVVAAMLKTNYRLVRRFDFIHTTDFTQEIFPEQFLS